MYTITCSHIWTRIESWHTNLECGTWLVCDILCQRQKSPLHAPWLYTHTYTYMYVITCSHINVFEHAQSHDTHAAQTFVTVKSHECVRHDSTHTRIHICMSSHAHVHIYLSTHRVMTHMTHMHHRSLWRWKDASVCAMTLHAHVLSGKSVAWLMRNIPRHMNESRHTHAHSTDKSDI